MLDKLATPEYWEGVEAARNGKSIDDCPYIAATKRHDWRTGFDNEIMEQKAPE